MAQYGKSREEHLRRYKSAVLRRKNHNLRFVSGSQLLQFSSNRHTHTYCNIYIYNCKKNLTETNLNV